MSVKNLADYVIVDLETTGLNKSDEIIEIGALRVTNHIITQSFSTLVKPSKHIPIEASIVNNIYDETVENCPAINTALTAFDGFICSEDVLLGHNISGFDVHFLQRDYKQYLNKELTNRIFDTLHCSRREMKFLGSHSLEGLSAYYGVDYTGAHRALQDCFITYQVYEKMLHDDFKDMLRICPECGDILKLRLGKHGWFYGCHRYPLCKHCENFEPIKHEP